MCHRVGFLIGLEGYSENVMSYKSIYCSRERRHDDLCKVLLNKKSIT